MHIFTIYNSVFCVGVCNTSISVVYRKIVFTNYGNYGRIVMVMKVKINMKRTGTRIMQRRKELGLKQRDFAEMVELSENQISNIENGANCPSMKSFVKICNALGVTPDYFMLGSIKDEPIGNICDSLKLLSFEEQKMISKLIETYIFEKDKQ